MEKEKCEYERYKLYWMLAHGYTLQDLIEELQLIVNDDADAFEVPTLLQPLFDKWESEVGFSGEIWPCFKEYLDELSD